MADLQTSLEKARQVVLVSFVSDPDLTRPDALSEIAREYGARPGRWLFLRGAPTPPTDRLLVVDGAGQIRAAFDERDPDLSSEVLDAVGALIRESARR